MAISFVYISSQLRDNVCLLSAEFIRQYTAALCAIRYNLASFRFNVISTPWHGARTL
jgi:hypothetical protein